MPPVAPADRTQRLPLSFAQQRLWFVDRLEPGSVEYNVPMPFRLGGVVDVAALGMALSALAARHEVLRTRLVAGPEGTPHQVIDPPSPFPLPVADVTEAADPGSAAERLVRAEAAAPFDLAAGPLIRGCLIRLAPEDHVLVVSVHHVVFDEWSGGILERDLTALYQAFRAGGPDPLPPLPVQYADFAVWQRDWLTGQVMEEQLAYWRGQLAQAPVLELPADRPRPRLRSSAGAITTLAVPAEVMDGVRRVTRESGATMFMTLFAVFTVLLGRYSGQEDVVVGTPVANRNRVETEDLIGFFVNALVLRTDLSGDPEFGALLGRVRTMALEAYAHQDLPFEQIVDELVTDRDRSRTPLFQVLFNYVVADERDTTGPLIRVEDMAIEPIARVDLRLLLAEDGDGGLMGGLEFSTALFDVGRMERMAGHLLTLLEAVAAGPGVPVSRLGMLTAAERDQLAGWNATAAPLPSAVGAHELVAAAAARYPDAVAVTGADGSLTYAGLVERAGRLAAVLSAAGRARRRWSGCACRAAWTWSPGSWRPGGAGRRTCRLTRVIPRPGWGSCWPTARRRWWSAPSRPSGNCRPGGAG